MQNKINQKVPIAKMDELIAAIKESGGGGKMYMHRLYVVLDTTKTSNQDNGYVSSLQLYVMTTRSTPYETFKDAYIGYYGNAGYQVSFVDGSTSVKYRTDTSETAKALVFHLSNSDGSLSVYFTPTTHMPKGVLFFPYSFSSMITRFVDTVTEV